MWTDLGLREDELLRIGRKVVRHAGKQVLLLAQEGNIFAIANRCPHEGYPLSEGTAGPGCVLTCNWHNWKFDVQSGAALVGRDPVRTYPLDIRDGVIFANLSDPPPEVQRARALSGLDRAVADNDHPRIAREIARLARAGFDARDALIHAISAVNDRLEFGTTHAHAAAADWLALAERAPGTVERSAALIEPVVHLSWDTLGSGYFPYPQQIQKFDTDTLVASIEVEDEANAIAQVRGALASGTDLALLKVALGRAAMMHYADFGHSVIYVHKTTQLIARLNGRAAEPILFALARSLVNATREDRLPEFRGYARAITAWGSGNERPEAQRFIGASINEALHLTLASSAGSPRMLYDTLLEAAAWNLLHFDQRVDTRTDNSFADNVSWLDFTHALTFANAARNICEVAPDLWPQALLQLTLFVGRNSGYVDTHQDIAKWRISDPRDFIATEMLALYDHGIVEPIIACHRLKTLFALENELTDAPDAPWAPTMCAAMNRWLASPQKRHHGMRRAFQAQDFIAREG